jgi:hypothetical protein
MARTATLDRTEWQTALDQLTADHSGDRVTIEVVDPTVGPRPEARRLPFAYLNYDPKDDVVIVAVGGKSPQYPVVLRHLVWHPTEVDIATEELPQPAVRVVEPDGTTTLVIFHPDQT